MFADEPIKEGDIIIVWGGIVLTEEDIRAGRYRKGALLAISEKLWLGGPLMMKTLRQIIRTILMQPNLWMKD